MRIGTFNIHGGRDGLPERKLALSNIAETIASAQLDVCLLQEVDRRLARSRFIDQAAYLARNASSPDYRFVFYGRLDFGPIGGFGNAILAREPFASVRRLPLPSSGGEPRAALGVTIGQNLAIWNTHLGLRDDWRVSQLSALVNAINADIAAGRSVLLGGDFNALIDSGEISGFLSTTGLIPVSTEAATFPATGPTHRIDFLFGTPNITVMDSGIITAPESSDHCLLWSALDISEKS